MRRSVVAVLLLGVLLVSAPGCQGIRERMAMKKAHELYKAQKYDEAIKKYKEILVMDPGNYTATYQIAMSNLAMYHPGSAHEKDKAYAAASIEHLEKLMAMQAPDKETQERVVKYYLSLLASAEMSDKAIAFMEKELAKDPKNIETVLQLANLYAKKGDFPNAWRYFLKRAEMDPKNKEAWYTVGVVAWERSYKGKEAVSDSEREQTLIPQGLAAFDKAIAIDPDYFDALVYANLLYREKAAVLGRQQRLEEAEVAFTTAKGFAERAQAARKKQMEAEKAKAGAGA
ncbi:MAG: tetratricopeptide repeat protein [Acidobacteria bacterium]|jgi:tetratricopeptide (TPR) repeat protein|nr:tetratricopeptide repeat protein [Acidobacteriota bacterium]